MSTTPNVPYRLEFSVEVPGTPEQVWQAIATAKGMSAWFLPTEMEEREGAHLAHQSAGQRDEVARRQVVGVGVRVGRGRADGRRRHDVRRRRRLQHPLGDAPVPALLGQFHQAVRLERLEVVVDLLAREPHPGGESGGRSGDGQLAEQPGPDRIQRGGGCLRALDDLDVLHDATIPLTRNLVKGMVVLAPVNAAPPQIRRMR